MRAMGGIAAGVLGAAMAVAIVITTVAPISDPLLRPAIWGIVLLVSFTGWGSVLARFVSRDRPVDCGLRLAWGMAVTITAGGILCLVTLASHSGLFAWVIGGVVAQCVSLWRQWNPVALSSAARRRPLTTSLIAVAAAVLLGIPYYGGTAGPRLTQDDTVSYLAFVEQILERGTLIEPFSLRRLAAYGGQSLMHALVQIGSDNPLQAPFFDIGICLVMVVVLIVADGGILAVGMWLLPVLLVLTLPNTRTNTTSLMSGAVLFLALFRTACAPAFDDRPRQQALVIGMLAAAAATLRHSYLVPAGAFVALLYAPGILRSLRERRWHEMAEVAIAPASMALCVLPWALLSYRSSGTLLYPLFAGNYQLPPSRWSVPTLEHRLTFIWDNLRYCHPVLSLPLFVLAALLIPWRSTRGALPALVGASMAGFFAIVWGFPNSNTVAMARYYFGFVVATMLAVSMHVCAYDWRAWKTRPARMRAAGLVLAIATIIQIVGIFPGSRRSYHELVTGVARPPAQQPKLIGQLPRYRELQSSIPAGAPILAMFDQSFWLDFGRNPISLLDLPGEVSPPPGMPIDDDEALATYLQALGYRYVALVRPHKSEWPFRRDIWEALAGPYQVVEWQSVAPIYVKVFDRLDGLVASRGHLYDDGALVVLDLAARSPG